MGSEESIAPPAAAAHPVLLAAAATSAGNSELLHIHTPFFVTAKRQISPRD